MKHTVFETPGAFDLRSITTMGMTAKPTSDNPIGRFGSGLKYAISVLLRNGASIDLYCNGDHYTFFTESEEFRGSMFHRIMYKRENGLLRIFSTQELPYTTEFGKHWELWQAFRELYANTLDENGECWLATIEQADNIGKLKDHTYIVIESLEFANLFPRRGEIFLDPTRETVTEVEGVGNITAKKTQHLYFRGMRAFDLPEDQPAQFTYNVIKEVELTEDRTIKSEYEYKDAIKEVIIASEDKAFIRAVLTAPEKSYEHQNLDFSYEYGASQAFKEVTSELVNKPGTNRSIGAYHSRYVSPPKQQLIDDNQWLLVLKGLSEAEKRIQLLVPIHQPQTAIDVYEEEMKKVFER